MNRVDISIIEVTGPTGRGKTTLAVNLALIYAMTENSPIVANLPLRNLPKGIEARVVKTAQDLMEARNCIILWDEAYNSFPSTHGWIAMQNDKKLTQLVSNARKNDVRVLIFTSQLKRAVKNSLRLNSKFVCIPTGTLADGYPEFLLWNDIDQFEHTRDSGSYDGGSLHRAYFKLEYLDTVFNTREQIVVEW